MHLGQCARAIFRLLFFSDLWPFGLSINTTARMKKDVPLPRFMPVQRTAFRRFSRKKIKMSSIELKMFFILAMLCCAAAECNSSVGLEHNELPDHSIGASSYSSGHDPHLGRLNNKIRKINETKTVWGAWCAKDSDLNQYLQIDLGVVRNVTGVATQGYDYGGMTISYQIMYSLNGKQWFQYKENGTTKLFNGNDDADTIVMHKFNRRLPAKFIRFNPRSWTSMICMRVDIYACELPIAKSTSTVPPTTKEISTKRKTSTFKNTEASITDPDSDVKTKKVEEELKTPTEGSTSFDNRANTGALNFCSIPLLIGCTGLVLNRLFN